MIVTVTLNPALDLTYEVDALIPHGTHRVAAVAERAGGKGLNVARVLHTAGEPVLATGLLGGGTGERVAALLARDGLASSFAPIAGETRRTVAVADHDDATGFWEPGPLVTGDEWDAFRARYAGLLADATVVVLSGSLPRGLPADAYATLITAARQAGVRSILDTSGDPLRAALAAAPDVVKPNREELLALVTAVEGAGDAVADGDEPDGELVRLAQVARGLGAGTVVASAGPDGLVAVTADGVWRARPPEVVDGNPTGAGDASVAALARGLRDRSPWRETLADAVALSAAAVASPVAGGVDAGVAARFRPAVAIAADTAHTAAGIAPAATGIAPAADTAATTTDTALERPEC